MFLALAALLLVTQTRAGAQPAVTLEAIESKLERAEDAAIASEGQPGDAAATVRARERDLKALEAEVARLRALAATGHAIAPADLAAVDARLDHFIARTGAPPAPVVEGEVPAGVEIDVQLRPSPAGKRAAGDMVLEGVTLVDLRDAHGVLIPAGSVLRGAIVREGGTQWLRGTRRAMHFSLLETPSGSYAVDLSVAGPRTRAQAARDAEVRAGVTGGVVPGRSIAPAARRDRLTGPIVRLRFDTPLTLQ